MTLLSLDAVRQLKAEVFDEDKTRVVTVSAVGDIENVQAGRFDLLLNDDTIDFASPHFERSAEWDTETGDRIDLLRDHIKGSWPIHLQEEARRGNTCSEDPEEVNWCCGENDANCHEQNFLTALGLAAQEGAAGWLFHTDAGFELDDPTVDSFWGELDSVEQSVMDAMTATLGEFRCLPAPVYSDNFNDAADDTVLKGRALQTGSALWDAAQGQGWKFETWNGRLTSVSYQTTATAGIPYHLPLGFDGAASVEATLVRGPAPAVSIGFSENPWEDLANVGRFWVSLEDDYYLHIYRAGPVELATIYSILPVTEATVKLEYRGGPKASLRLYAKSLFGGWAELFSDSVTETVIGAAVVEIDHGIIHSSYLDSFAARLNP